MISTQDMIEIMREALGKIARNRKDCGKPALTRREMQHEARQALIGAGYPSWAENVTGRVPPMEVSHEPR